mgnify:CR=1 FL=1
MQQFMTSNLTDVIRGFVEGCQRLLAVRLQLFVLVALCLVITVPAIDDLNILLSRNFVRQYAIPSFQPEPLSFARIVPYFWIWPFYATGWVFLLGGLLEVIMRREVSETRLFIRSCRRYFLRFVRLFLLEFCLKGLVLFIGLDILNSNLGDSISVVSSFCLLLIVLFLGLVTVVFTYATIRAFAEDRLSMIGSVVVAARFVKRRFGSVVILTLLNIGVFTLGVVGAVLIVQPETINDVPLFFSFLCIVQLMTVLTTYSSAMSYVENQFGSYRVMNC